MSHEQRRARGARRYSFVGGRSSARPPTRSLARSLWVFRGTRSRSPTADNSLKDRVPVNASSTDRGDYRPPTARRQ